MEDDLGMEGNQYQTAVSLLFVTYILSELPSNLVLKKLKPSRWISFITTRYVVEIPIPAQILWWILVDGPLTLMDQAGES